MADLRRSVNTRIWSDEWFETLKPTEKLLWLYLLTNERTNMLGCYEVSMKRISYESGIDESMVRKAFEAFERIGKAYYLGGKYVFLPNWLKNQSMNTNMVKSAKKDYRTLPESVVRAIWVIVGEGFESLSKGLQMLPKIESEIEIEIEDEVEIEKPRKINSASDIPSIDDCIQASQMSGFTKEQGEAYYHFRNANGWMVARGKDGNLFPIANWRSDMVMAISKGYLEKQQDKTKPDMKEVYKGFKPL
jgi:hypothetical protein